jgi:hypothetical protein
MIVNLQNAGFETGFTSLYWTYASGFPKAMNISKMVDKRMGVEREILGQHEPFGREGRNVETGFGTGNIYGDGRVPAKMDITEPATPEGKKLDGSYGGFQPKPAVEVILVTMKSMSEKTFIDQALTNQKGITWLDDGRIPYKSETDKDGRFPANLLVSDDILNDGKMRKSEGKRHPGTGESQIYAGGKGDINTLRELGQDTGYRDSGDYSRYFDLDAWFEKKLHELPREVQKVFPFLIVPKASKSEKNKGLIVKPGKSARPSGVLYNKEEPNGFRDTLKKLNFHPTVKPIQIGSYLITLGSRIGDIVLDPFCGSGSFPIAAKILRREYIGIDINEKYIKITEARLKAVPTIKRLDEYIT